MLDTALNHRGENTGLITIPSTEEGAMLLHRSSLTYSIISRESKSAEPNRVAPLLPNSDKAEKLGEIEEQPNGVH
jgi:hypothetical protein